MKRFTHWITLTSLYLFIGLLAPGCGGGSSVGNGLVSIENTPYSNSQRLLRAFDVFPTDLFTSITEFKFCITKIQMTNSDGQAVAKEGATSIEAILGLVNASSASQTTSWGQVNIPVGFVIQEFTVEVHKDAENCSGAGYSALYNGTELTKDLEFQFAFDPVVSLNAGDTLKLGLTAIASAFEQASQQGKLNNEQISEFLQASTKGTGTK